MRRLAPSSPRVRFLHALVIALLSAAPASAGPEVVDFDEAAAANMGVPLSEEYAAQGVHFFSVDDAVVHQEQSDSDTRDWQVEGSSGPRFLGLDGASYAVVLTFDAPVLDFQIDLTRAAPHPFMAHSVTLVGLRDGEVVEEQSLYLGAVDSWTTVTLVSELDQVVVEGPGQPGTRFALDNVRWTGPDPEVPEEPNVIEVRVHARRANWHRLWSRGGYTIFPVALYGDDRLDVNDVDLSSLEIGPGYARIKPRGRLPVMDLDRDGIQDLLILFRVRSSNAPRDGESMCLVGATLSGDAFSGCVEPGVRPSRRSRSLFRAAQRR